jgi:hypothetical protein
MSSTSPTPQRKPTSPRVASTPKRRRGRFWLLILVVALLLCVIASALSYSLVTSFLGAGFVSTGGGNAPTGGSQARSAAAAATDFMDALKARHYAQAYSDLASTLLATMTSGDFARQAGQSDTCFGAVTDYTLTRKGADQFIYAVRRSRLPRAYPFQLTLQEDSPGYWAITDYGPGLTLDPPGAAPCQ